MSTSLKLILATTAVLVNGAAGIAVAHPADGPDRAALEQKFDLDKHGTLDDAEFAKLKQAFHARRAERRAQRLAQFDANKNGALDPAEQQAMHDQRVAERFKQLDTNADGKLSLDEFKAGRSGPGMHGQRGFGKHGQRGFGKHGQRGFGKHGQRGGPGGPGRGPR